MLHERKVVVVVPAFNEEPRIAHVIRTMPAFVDAIVVVDDASTDRTRATAEAVGDPRVEVITLEKNSGVGAAIYRGYEHAIALSSHACDAFAVMAGDAQMDPDDLERVVTPIVKGRAGYVKGNRFRHGEWRRMPLVRYVGGRILSLMTRVATGAVIDDSQCGYTGLSRQAADSVDFAAAWKGYGYPNDLFARLVEARVTTEEVVVRPIYADEESKLGKVAALRVGLVVLRAGVRRGARACGAPASRPG